MPNFSILQPLAQQGKNNIMPLMDSQPQQEDTGLLGGLGDALKGLGKGMKPKPVTKAPTAPNEGMLSQASGNSVVAPPQQQGLLGAIAPQTQAAQNAKFKSSWDVANSMVGLNERDDSGTLTSFFAKAGQHVNPQTTPWCATFVNGVLGATGQKGTGSAAARSFLNYGTPTDKPSQGDIVVLSRTSDPTKGHVGFYAGTNPDGSIKILGGNQGDKVSITNYPANRVLGYRRPPTGEQIQQAIAPKDSHAELPYVMAGIAKVESGGTGNPYGAMSKPSKNGDRAYGKYQIMGNNIPSWTREALGIPMTPQQFANDPGAQERVAAYKLNQYLQQTGSPQEAASMWFSGRPIDKAGSSKDAYGTDVPTYVNRFNQGYLASKPKNVALNPGYDSPMSTTPNLPHNVYEDTVRHLDQGRDSYAYNSPGAAMGLVPNVKAFDPTVPASQLTPQERDLIMRKLGGGTLPPKTIG